MPDSVPVYHQDLLELDIAERVDVVFSCAVFHWISDHGRLFERLHRVLKPGGRLVAQCGGKGNIQNVLDVVGERPGRWLYAAPEETEERLRRAGFAQARAWLEPKPTVPADMATFVATVILHEDPNARENAERVAAQIDHIDYVRLNIEATARLEHDAQALEEALMVRDPVEDRAREDDVDLLGDVELEQVLVVDRDRFGQ